MFSASLLELGLADLLSKKLTLSQWANQQGSSMVSDSSSFLELLPWLCQWRTIAWKWRSNIPFPPQVAFDQSVRHSNRTQTRTVIGESSDAILMCLPLKGEGYLFVCFLTTLPSLSSWPGYSRVTLHTCSVSSLLFLWYLYLESRDLPGSYIWPWLALVWAVPCSWDQQLLCREKSPDSALYHRDTVTVL